MTLRSYDEKQAAAVLTRYTRCGRERFMTKPEPVCLACREADK